MNIGVIFAGGVGSRMHSKDKPKQFLEIYNKPIIIYTLEHFENCPEIDCVVVACIEDWIEYLRSLITKYNLKKVKKIVPGGKTGQFSIYNGLVAAKSIITTSTSSTIPSSAKNVDKSCDEYVDKSEKKNDFDDIVLIHDGVRPLINSKLLSENIAAVKKYGSCITAGIVKETIVEIDDDSNVMLVPDRAHSRVAKAPQSFYLKDILSVHQRAMADGIDNSIDSCTLMQAYGYKLHMIDGPYENIKITTPDDYYTMRAILQAMEDAQIYGL